ncbi:UBX domain-containing protein 4 [Aplysia californica]|uniref:UBX domain-containing protein 4 n=1 Tax=Aplysia californica TaxID=6500 RepID=A0ABM0JNS6_APLCA|nr:UBX domain-containing protein 4 [Aplysia californica]
MKWFEGGIPSAIQTAKSNNSVFIVFVTGDGESSAEMESRLNSEDVTQLCESKNCVAVKLQADSNDCKFFSQIYPVVLIPSTFFIANSGVPLEVIGQVTSQEDFLAKVKAAIEMQDKMTSEQGATAAPASPPAQQQQQQAASSSATETATAESAPGASADTEEVAGATAADDTSAPEEKKQKVSEDLGTRVERAKQLVDLKRDEKMQKEAEEAKKKEYERRELGQGLQKLKEKQKEMEILEAKKELKKSREEDKLARQKVKEEIARDRAEKAARFGKEKEERAQAQEEVRKRKLEEQAAQAEEQARRSEFARIQFRKPDGSSVNHQFTATETFASVHRFITEHMGCNVSLSTTFPRRTFTPADHSSTLQELQLAPSAAILVIPGNMSTQGVRGSDDSSLSISSITGLLFAPFVFVWNMIASLLGLSGPSAPPARAQEPKSVPEPSATGGDRSLGNTNRRSAAAASSRQEGAIHRFHNAQDDEDPDDKNTWNGNSTQQM